MCGGPDHRWVVAFITFTITADVLLRRLACAGAQPPSPAPRSRFRRLGTYFMPFGSRRGGEGLVSSFKLILIQNTCELNSDLIRLPLQSLLKLCM